MFLFLRRKQFRNRNQISDSMEWLIFWNRNFFEMTYFVQLPIFELSKYAVSTIHSGFKILHMIKFSKYKKIFSTKQASRMPYLVQFWISEIKKIAAED